MKKLILIAALAAGLMAGDTSTSILVKISKSMWMNIYPKAKSIVAYQNLAKLKNGSWTIETVDYYAKKVGCGVFKKHPRYNLIIFVFNTPYDVKYLSVIDQKECK